MTPVKVIKKSLWTKNPKLILFFQKSVMLWANFAEIDMVKLKKNRELGVLTSGWSQKKSGN